MSRSRTFSVLAAGLFAGFVSATSSALSLGPGEFVAARQVTCILAQDALGYLNEADFDDLIDSALDNYDEAEGDVIYAKALGYFDGLMFGIAEQDRSLVNERLRTFNASEACTSLVNSSLRI